MNKVLSNIALALHGVALFCAAAGLWGLYQIFTGVSESGEAQVTSIIFAIGLAVIPYCLATGFSRMVAVGRDSGD